MTRRYFGARERTNLQTRGRTSRAVGSKQLLVGPLQQEVRSVAGQKGSKAHPGQKSFQMGRSVHAVPARILESMSTGLLSEVHVYKI